MKGTVLKPKYLREGAREKHFLEAWRDDAHTAFIGLFEYRFIGFDYSGRGNEYWTAVGHILYEGLVPQEEYAVVAIAYMETYPLTRQTWRAYEEILQENVPAVSEWVLYNFERLNGELREFMEVEKEHGKNLAYRIEILLIHRIATAPSKHLYRKFLQKYWYEHADWVGPIFEAAFCVDGKYGVEADKAIFFFIRRCRVIIRNIRKDYYDNMKSCKRRYRKDYHWIKKNDEKRVVDSVRSLLYERFNAFPRPWVNHDTLSPEEKEAVTRRWKEISEKVERIIVSQCARCPL